MSFLGSDNAVWFDGKLVSDSDANISVMSHTLHYGSGVFEGVRAYETPQGPAIFRLEDHTRRFLESARMIRMHIPFDEQTLNQALKEVVSHNRFSSAYIRPIAFYSADALGVVAKKDNRVHVVVAAWKWDKYFNFEESGGISAMTSTFRRQNINSVLSKAKVNGYYINSMLALQEAQAHGFQEAILFDANGFIAEGSSANIFLVKNGNLVTPHDNNILPGITRDCVKILAKDMNISVTEKNLTRDELYLADEIFFTGTAAEISPVSTVDGLEVGNGKMGPVTSRLHKAYHDAVTGKAGKYSQWNTPCK